MIIKLWVTVARPWHRNTSFPVFNKQCHSGMLDLCYKWSCILHRFSIAVLYWTCSRSHCQKDKPRWKAETSGLHEGSLYFYFSQCSGMTWSPAAVPQAHTSSLRTQFAWHCTKPASLKLEDNFHFVSDNRPKHNAGYFINLHPCPHPAPAGGNEFCF